MGRFLTASFLAAVLLTGVEPVAAHHSFAVYFDSTKTIKVQGTVTEFRFSNPHGMIAVSVKNASGATEVWRAETNSPAILRRRGWNKDSLKVGETITIEGWAARDDRKYVRMSRVTRADGTVVGTPMTLSTVTEGDQK